jgi:hypothetical protein
MAREETSSLLVPTGEGAPRLLRRAAAPMLDDRLNDGSSLLDTLRPLIARPPHHAGRRRNQHERPNDVRMRGRKQHGQRAALGNRDQHRMLRARCFDHRTDVIDLFLQRRRPGNPSGHPGPTPVELDQPRERRELPEKARPGRQLPVDLDVREERRHNHDVERGLAHRLVGDLQITTPRIPRDNLHLTQRMSPRDQASDLTGGRLLLRAQSGPRRLSEGDGWYSCDPSTNGAGRREISGAVAAVHQQRPSRGVGLGGRFSIEGEVDDQRLSGALFVLQQQCQEPQASPVRLLLLRAARVRYGARRTAPSPPLSAQ